jgi:lipopolysaccharide export system protein LptA
MLDHQAERCGDHVWRHSCVRPAGRRDSDRGYGRRRGGPRPAAVGSRPREAAGVANALQGFSHNRDQPVKITAAELQVHDEDKTAVFFGDQGDTSMRLAMYYDDQPPLPAPPSKSGNGANVSAQITPRQIKKIEAKGSVLVKQKDQTAAGDLGTFDMRADIVTMSGNLFITRGPNVLMG